MWYLAVNKWNRFPNFLLFAVMKVLQNEKFLEFLSVSSISSLNIPAVYIQAPYKVVSYKKSVYFKSAML